ncbi:MAG TPA: malto-oligosyltrehalose synthase [Steroidobacteraceae bacterium]|jgi:(1->4)-alpha-D-glucan 1-alpha-D-glucosylmutase|nr:malto-oligosyltrehalose synthase [Steroidobacteraceae bacterium]
MTPRVTYRLQLSAEFDFDAAAAVAGYLANLGISHVYLSPCFAARAGSTHGYDIVDHNRVSDVLGGGAGHARLIAALREHGLAVIQDFVPNHVGIGGADNSWWLDVLEWGRASPHAAAFDIQWSPEPQDVAGRVLIPLLGEQYGKVLESGGFSLRFDAATGSLSFWIEGGHRLPLRPQDYGDVLADTSPALAELAGRFSQVAALPDPRAEVDDLKRRLADAVREPAVREAIDNRLRELSGVPGEPDSFDAVDRLIGRQHWRAASWRVAAHDINYRRFFNVNELAGLRVEVDAVFDAVHRLVFEWLQRGDIDGLRIDHIDGLYDPAGYCRRLKAGADRPFYLVVEKILARHEQLPAGWPVDGTTGYEFAALLSGLFIDAESADEFTRVYESFTGQRDSFDTQVTHCKRLVMRSEMAGELTVLAREAAAIARQQRHTRDFTLHGLHEALTEIIAHFPVYRTYVDETGATEIDRKHIQWAVGRARAVLPETDESLFEFLTGLLTGDNAAILSPASRTRASRFGMKFQQYTGPVTAKGIEDKALFRYNRLLCLNEVGSHPEQFGISADAFHQESLRRQKLTPHGLLATSTHDTKRGEDARARLVALSEFPGDWETQVRAWSRLIRARLADVEATAPPVANEEYLMLQMLLAHWPAEFSDPAIALQAEHLAEFGQRLEAAVMKSLRESGSQTSWSRPMESYEARVRDYLAAALDVSRPNGFLDIFRPFQARLARVGVSVSLCQLVLKLTVPGIPDVYQGTERWDLNFVDPDNRRNVDYELRRQSLAASQDADISALLSRWQDGEIKQAVMAKLLRVRRSYPELFEEGECLPLTASGDGARHVVAFLRRLRAVTLLVVVVRLPYRWENGVVESGPLLQLPADDAAGQAGPWRDVLSGRSVRLEPVVQIRPLLKELPCGVYLSERSDEAGRI